MIMKRSINSSKTNVDERAYSFCPFAKNEVKYCVEACVFHSSKGCMLSSATVTIKNTSGRYCPLFGKCSAICKLNRNYGCTLDL